jgi:glutathione S-transferase
MPAVHPASAKENAMKLYYAPQTRAGRPRWLLEEIGAPYEIVPVDLSKGEHKTAAHLKIHPHGAVPAFSDGDLTMFESAAICAYLADRFPEKGFAPAVGTAARGLYYQWMFYAMVTLEPPVLQVFLHTRMLPEAERVPAMAEQGRTKFGGVARVLAPALTDKPFILGAQFSAADVMLGATLIWAGGIGLLAEHPELVKYCERLQERPAYKRSRV